MPTSLSWITSLPWWPSSYNGIACRSNEGSFAGAQGGITAFNLDGFGIGGTLPLQLRELRTSATVSLARNSLSGSIPSCWGRLINWTNFAMSTGFDNCNLLSLGGNALTSSIPQFLGNISSSPSTTTVGLAENNLSSTVPASLTSLLLVTLAYNPRLVGTLPPGLTVAAPFPTTLGQSNQFLFATSIGLDRPMTDILSAAQAALDPNATVLQWAGSNPCNAWANTAQNTYQVSASASFGQSWNGITCKDTYTTPALSATAEGGVLSLAVAFPSFNATRQLTGSLPTELRELRTATFINLGGHLLTGPVPQCWGQNFSRNFFQPTAGFEKVTVLGLANNQLQGNLPPLLGTGMPPGAFIALDNNNVSGVLPSSLSFKSVTIANNWAVYGSIPPNVTVVSSADPTTGALRRLSNTSIGLNDAMSNVLLAAKPGLDTIGVLNGSWVLGSNPCTNWTGVVCGENATVGGVQQLLLDSQGLNGTVACELLRLSTLRVLWLHSNTLNGQLTDLSALSLTSFRINTNRLAGSIPSAYGSMGVPFNFSVFNNPQLCGTVPGNLTTTGQLFGGTMRTLLGPACAVTYAQPAACPAQPGLVAPNVSAVSCPAVVYPPPSPPPPAAGSICAGVPNTAYVSPACPVGAPPASPPPTVATRPPGFAAPPMLYSLPSGMYAYYTAVSF